MILNLFSHFDGSIIETFPFIILLTGKPKTNTKPHFKGHLGQLINDTLWQLSLKSGRFSLQLP
jgi:hypothetical protein